jgi:cupin 2 domain-containing protein
METANLFHFPPAPPHGEALEVLAENPWVSIERIVSRGHRSPEGFWYDQDRNEWVVMLRGRAALLFEGEESPRVLEPGDALTIPAHARHRVEWTDVDQDTVWLAVFYA